MSDNETINELTKFFELLLQPKKKIRAKFAIASQDQLYKMAKLMRRAVAKTDDQNIHALINERCEEIAELAEAEILSKGNFDDLG